MITQIDFFDPVIMGKQLKRLRNSISLSQEKFAENIGMSKDSVYNYEKGKTAIPHDLVKKLCVEFNVSADYFYFEIDKPLKLDIEYNKINSFEIEIAKCTDLEKKQIIEILKVIRMKSTVL